MGNVSVGWDRKAAGATASQMANNSQTGLNGKAVHANTNRGSNRGTGGEAKSKGRGNGSGQPFMLAESRGIRCKSPQAGPAGSRVLSDRRHAAMPPQLAAAFAAWPSHRSTSRSMIACSAGALAAALPASNTDRPSSPALLRAPSIGTLQQGSGAWPRSRAAGSATRVRYAEAGQSDQQQGCDVQKQGSRINPPAQERHSHVGCHLGRPAAAGMEHLGLSHDAVCHRRRHPPAGGAGSPGGGGAVADRCCCFCRHCCRCREHCGGDVCAIGCVELEAGEGLAEAAHVLHHP